MRLLFFIIFAAGIGNTVLRPEIENPFTLYRLLAPIGLVVLSAARPKFILKGFAWFAVFTLYNFVLATAYSGDFSQLLPSLVHYFYLFVLLILMVHMKYRVADFDENFLKFVLGFYIFLLLNLAIEAVTGLSYPNLYEDPTEERFVRAFFWNQNDLAIVLCVIGWMALTLNRFAGTTRVAVTLLTLAILYYNDSKSALLSFIIFSVPIAVIFRICATKRIAPSIWFISFGTVAVMAVMLLIAISDLDISFANDTYTFDELLVRPILNILTLQSSGEDWGSINNRTDAAIFVTIEYLRSFGFGLGAGGSWLVLTLPQYLLAGAQSPHNALLQFVVDFGYPILLGYIALTIWALRRLFKYRLGEYDRLKVIAILSFPMLGLSQSGAIVTNYFFWGSIYFIVMLGHGHPAVRRDHSKSTAATPISSAYQPKSVSV